MLTFTDTPVTKQRLIEALEAHQKAGSGCAVGCSLHDFGENPSDHSAYERLFGIPMVLARLEDGIFEGLPIEDAKAWPLRFANAVPVGKDLSLVWPRFAVWLLADPKHGVLRFARTERSKMAIQAVADAYARVAAGGDMKAEDWRELSAAAAAYAAAAAAAYAAAAAAAYASYAAAAAYASYASYAAAAYAASDAPSVDARIKARKAQADKLIELLETA